MPLELTEEQNILAYTPIGDSQIIYPIGYVMNDAMTYYYIADLIQRYHIRKIVL